MVRNAGRRFARLSTPSRKGAGVFSSPSPCGRGPGGGADGVTVPDVAPRIRIERRVLRSEPDFSGLLRHIAACRNARLPGNRVPLRIGAALVGWIGPAVLNALRDAPEARPAPDGGLSLADGTTALESVAGHLVSRGLARWRGEA